MLRVFCPCDITTVSVVVRRPLLLRRREHRAQREAERLGVHRRLPVVVQDVEADLVVGVDVLVHRRRPHEDDPGRLPRVVGVEAHAQPVDLPSYTVFGAPTTLITQSVSTSQSSTSRLTSSGPSLRIVRRSRSTRSRAAGSSSHSWIFLRAVRQLLVVGLVAALPVHVAEDVGRRLEYRVRRREQPHDFAEQLEGGPAAPLPLPPTAVEVGFAALPLADDALVVGAERRLALGAGAPSGGSASSAAAGPLASPSFAAAGARRATLGAEHGVAAQRRARVNCALRAPAPPMSATSRGGGRPRAIAISALVEIDLEIAGLRRGERAVPRTRPSSARRTRRTATERTSSRPTTRCHVERSRPT